MTRLDDWQDRFFAYLEATRLLPFAWGTNDCCLFAAGSIDAITGSTLTAQLAESYAYTDEAGALAFVESFGSLEAAVSSWLGDAKAPNFAGPGDIILADLEMGPTIGVCLGVDCAFSGASGMDYRSRTFITACWTV
jgi:hypothetical protein